MPSELDDLPVLKKIDNNGDFVLDVDAILKRNYDDIGYAAAQIPAIIEYINEYFQVIVEQKIIAKQEIKEAEAAAYFDLKRGKFSEVYDSKVTENALEKAAVLETTVIDAHRRYAVLAGWYQRLSGLILSLQTKLDLLRSTEATRRKLIDDHEEDKDNNYE